ncbi:XRE family transcriptional regulator [Thioploca ingrica]|uniref:XRE family transcriptional regulator n=1 Tax=Thioploca ingrica TaxID=40754 RepID=A0A090AGL5_9GAMM|nr:XRE family transcriptional regulator [Thioploca ingrica]
MKSLRAKARKPTHPGAILREDVLPELHLTQTEFAKQLHLSRYVVSEIIHERRAITPDIAIRLARFLGTTASSWLNMQQAVDLWELEQHRKEEYDLIPQSPRRLAR